MALSTKTISETIRASVELPDPKDPLEWLAGGLGNETYPGGDLWSPTDTPGMNLVPFMGKNKNLLNGDFNYLNSGLMSVNSALSSGQYLDLVSTFRVSQVVNLIFTIQVIKDGNVISETSTHINEDGFNNDSISNDSMTSQSVTSEAEATISEVAAAYEGRFNALAPLENPSMISIVAVVQDVASGKITTVEQGFMSGIVGAMESVMTNVAMQAIASVFNTTSDFGLGLIGAVAKSIAGELTQTAIGLDVSIGFGGEYDKSVSQELNATAFSESKGFMGLESMAESIGFSLGLTTSLTVGYTNRAQTSIVGYSYTIDNPNQISFFGPNPASFTGVGPTLEEAMANAMDEEMDALNDYGSQDVGEGGYGGYGGFNDAENQAAAEQADNSDEADNPQDVGEDTGSSSDSGLL